MTVSSQDIIELLCTLAEEEKLRVTIRESLKGGLIAGGASFVGGILLGPIGLAIGGAIGGCVAAAIIHQRFLPAVQVIATMQPQQRDILAHNVKRIMDSIDVSDIAVFAAMVSGNLTVRKKVIEALIDYLRTEMSMAIVG